MVVSSTYGSCPAGSSYLKLRIHCLWIIVGLWVGTSTECECTVGDLGESHGTHGTCAGGGSCLNSSNNVNVLSETEELMVYVWMETHTDNLSLMGQVLSEVHVYIPPLTMNALPQMQTSSPALPLHAVQEANNCSSTHGAYPVWDWHLYTSKHACTARCL